MKKVHIVSIGAAVQDVFLQGKIFKPKKDDGDLVAQFELGTKNEVEAVTYSTGGGATNASVTFARLGMLSSYMGRLGEDIAAKAVLEDLAEEKVSTKLVWHTEKYGTGYSTILLSPSGERTILTYRGASAQYELAHKHFQGVKPDWFYISSLSGDVDTLKVIVEYAKKHDIKIAINPGQGELRSGAFRQLLPNFSLLSINKEELEALFGTADLYTLLKKANKDIPIVVVTDGPKGSYVIDGEYIYKAGMYKDVKVVDRAGAGDAFCSGFVAMIATNESVEKAITFGSANSTSVVSTLGAKTGILRSTNGLRTMSITKTKID